MLTCYTHFRFKEFQIKKNSIASNTYLNVFFIGFKFIFIDTIENHLSHSDSLKEILQLANTIDKI